MLATIYNRIVNVLHDENAHDTWTMRLRNCTIYCLHILCTMHSNTALLIMNMMRAICRWHSCSYGPISVVSISMHTEYSRSTKEWICVLLVASSVLWFKSNKNKQKQKSFLFFSYSSFSSVVRQHCRFIVSFVYSYSHIYLRVQCHFRVFTFFSSFLLCFFYCIFNFFLKRSPKANGR